MSSIFLRSAAAVVISVCALPNTRGAEVSAKPPTTGLRPPERVPEPQLYPASDEPLRAMAKFKIPPGCKVALWAAEPMLGNPVAFCLDEKGNVFTAETYRYRTSVLDIRHYMFMLEDDLASRTTADRIAYTKKNFPTDWQKLAIETEVIRRLEDSDGDGSAEKSTVYAAGMSTLLDGINSGVLAHEGQLWCTNIPNLWVFSGLTAEGAAAKREVLSAGYGVRYSFTGHDLHGLVIGPDGRLYFSFGDRGAHVVTREGKRLAFPDEGAVFRCELDGSNLEVVHRGLRNPQELAFDNHGNLFTGDNDSDQGDRERWVYLVEGGDSGWRVGFQHHPLGKEYNPWLAEQIWEPRNTGSDQPASILSPILNIPDGPSGIVYYPGTGLPPQFAGSFFVCGFKGTSARSAITSLKIKENGGGFATAQEPAEFIGDVQATDIDFGPDSRIYFSEWGEGWEGTGRGRIFRLEHGAAQSEQAAQIAEVKKLLGEGFTQRSCEQLTPLLAHADQRIRLRAQWALAKKPDGAPHLINAAMKGVDGAEKRLSRLHGIWGMGQKTKGGSHSALGWMEQLLNDSDEEVRAQMIKVLGELRFEPDVTRHTVALLTEALRAPQGRVRFFAAMSLARIFRQSAVKTTATSALPAPEVTQAVVQLLRQNADADEYLRHAGVMVLAAIGEGGIRTASDDAFPAVRLAAVLALRQLGNAEVGRFLGDSEPRIVKEAARAINDLPITDAYGALARLIEKPTNDRQLMIRVINANYRAGTTETAQALARFTVDGNAAETLRIEALNALGTWAQPLARDRVVGTYRSLPARDATPAATALKSVISQLLTSPTKRPPTETREPNGRDARARNNPALTRAQRSDGTVAESVSVGLAAIEAVERLQIKEAAPLLHDVMGAKDVPTRLRTRALRGLATLNDAKLQDAIKVALTDPAPALRVAASTILGRFQPEEAARQLGSAFAEAEIAEKKAVLVALGTLKTEAAYQTLDRLIDDLRANKIPADVRLELLEAAANTESPAVKTRLAAYESTLPANDPLARFDSTLAGGDAEAGEKLFKEHAVAQCARCHKVKGSGGEAGPDLTDIGTKKDRKYLLESIVVPNAQIAEGFQSQLVTLKNGEMQVGVIRNETPAELTLQTVVPGAAPITLKIADIQARESAPSGMPHGMGELLSKREIRDLVEYLTTLKESP